METVLETENLENSYKKFLSCNPITLQNPRIHMYTLFFPRYSLHQTYSCGQKPPHVKYNFSTQQTKKPIPPKTITDAPTSPETARKHRRIPIGKSLPHSSVTCCFSPSASSKEFPACFVSVHCRPPQGRARSATETSTGHFHRCTSSTSTHREGPLAPSTSDQPPSPSALLSLSR